MKKLAIITLLLIVAGVLLTGCMTVEKSSESASQRIEVFDNGGQIIQAIPICEDMVLCYYMYSAGSSVGISCIDLGDRPDLRRKYCE